MKHTAKTILRQRKSHHAPVLLGKIENLPTQAVRTPLPQAEGDVLQEGKYCSKDVHFLSHWLAHILDKRGRGKFSEQKTEAPDLSLRSHEIEMRYRLP
ncbi:hypothetical protein TNCT_42501 [Trichonephila clavata]|uniref:Uncharacterized protein n=1 Tax=Trichonephila clavata TaxID=2740835 RepID=A0A8X6L6I6_TRICU|nr:hypothetical protein TNCT_42501 [Trichonephila clavata]